MEYKTHDSNMKWNIPWEGLPSSLVAPLSATPVSSLSTDGKAKWAKNWEREVVSSTLSLILLPETLNPKGIYDGKVYLWHTFQFSSSF